MGGNPESTCTVSRENDTRCLFPASQWDRLKTELMVLLLSCFQAKSVGNKGKLKVKWLCPFAADPVVFPWTFQMRKESGILHKAASSAEKCRTDLFLPLPFASELCHPPYAWWEGLQELIHFKYISVQMCSTFVPLVST